MRLAFVYGSFSSSIHGGFKVEDLYVRKGLTGSESFFFNTVRGLAERGHEVTAYCQCEAEVRRAENLGGAAVRQLDQLGACADFDAVLTWNEPNYLRGVDPKVRRICVQQLNDFRSYCSPDWDAYVDDYFFPSAAHRAYMVESEKLPEGKCHVMANSINAEMFLNTQAKLIPGKIVYCSSPDRGLHWLLNFFPQIRARVPHASLHVFYRLKPWLDQVRYNEDEVGRRARYIDECLRRLGENGERGVWLHGSVPNEQMIRELKSAEVFAYPCDTTRYTEGFSVATLDACASGAAPIISDCDALGSIYAHAVHMIPGRPGGKAAEWIDTIARVLEDQRFRDTIAARALKFAEGQTRQARADQWEEAILRLILPAAIAPLPPKSVAQVSFR